MVSTKKRKTILNKGLKKNYEERIEITAGTHELGHRNA